MARDRSEVAEHLDYLSRLADELEVPSPLPTELADLVGHHEDLRAAARVWRKGAEDLEHASGDVQGALGGIDSAWQGQDADAFLGHIREVGLAGNDLVDTMRALADALEHTIEAVQSQLDDLGELAAEAANTVSAALLGHSDGTKRARKHLTELAEPVRELTESISDSYRAFARFCDDVEGGRATGSVQFDRRMPAQAWDFNAPAPAKPPAPAEPAGAGGGAGGGGAGGGAAGGGGASGGGGGSAAGGGGAEQQLSPGGTTQANEPSETPPAAAANAGGATVAAAGGAAVGGGMTGMMPMGMMGGMMGGAKGAGGQERKNESRLKSNPEELFGGPPQAPPAVFGESSDEPGPEQFRLSAEEPPWRPVTGQPSIDPQTPRPSIAEALHPNQPTGEAPPTSPASSDASITPPSRGDVSVTPPSRGDVSITPPSRGDVSVTPPSRGDVSVTPTSRGDVSITPPSRGDVSIAPPSRDDVSVTPPSRGDVSITAPSRFGMSKKADESADDDAASEQETASVDDAPPPKAKTGTASVGDAPPPKPRS